MLKVFYVPKGNFKFFFSLLYAISTFRLLRTVVQEMGMRCTVICPHGPQVMKFELAPKYGHGLVQSYLQSFQFSTLLFPIVCGQERKSDP